MLELSTDGWISQGDKEGKQCYSCQQMNGYIRDIRRESNVKVVNRWMDKSGR